MEKVFDVKFGNIVRYGEGSVLGIEDCPFITTENN